MSLFTDAIEQVQAAALGWPVSVVSRETSETHIRPGITEMHLICQYQDCGQSVFRLDPIAYDTADIRIDQLYVIKPQTIIDSIAAHIRQCHEDALRG